MLGILDDIRASRVEFRQAKQAWQAKFDMFQKFAASPSEGNECYQIGRHGFYRVNNPQLGSRYFSRGRTMEIVEDLLDSTRPDGFDILMRKLQVRFSNYRNRRSVVRTPLVIPA